MARKAGTEILSITVHCSCGETHELKLSEVRFYGDSGECEICGSHGSVDMEWDCPNEKRRGGYVTLSEW